MACPQITGIAALILSEHIGNIENGSVLLSPKELEERITKICVDLGNPGKDTDFGNGMPVFGHVSTDSISETKQKNWLSKLWDIIRGKVI
jgi:hypothetical protein